MFSQRNYLDFNLELRDLDMQANTFKVAVLPSPAVGEVSATTVTYNYEELEDALTNLEEHNIDQSGLIDLGEQLAGRLLPMGPVRDLFRGLFFQKANRDDAIRLRLVIHEPRLAQIPWEFSYLQMHQGEKSRNHFLVLNPRISIVRHEVLPEAHSSLTEAISPHLRLIATMANPKGYQPLQLNKEKRAIEQALSDFNVDGVTIEWQPFIERTTLEDLITTLQNKADVFHFAGHGEFQMHDVDPPTNEPRGMGGIVLLKDKRTREPFLLNARDLAVHLQNAGVRLVVLGACESGRRDGISAWTGIAPALIERGILAVVAMQYKVNDEFAIAFSQMFYRSLASGLSVDEAVSAGRLALIGKMSEDDVNWGIPVLYMRSVDSVIFPRSADQKSETADQIRHWIEQEVETIERGGTVTGIKAGENLPGTGSFKVTQRVNTVKGNMIGGEFKR